MCLRALAGTLLNGLFQNTMKDAGPGYFVKLQISKSDKLYKGREREGFLSVVILVSKALSNCLVGSAGGSRAFD